ncbi:hypothetical protein [Xenorhabdus hominickii]|uniref:Aminoglycoside adenylyltransferase n=1 Tax=Xenorhabdus hominickii TaxID=351679 RepID=A0A2G0Q300_XENHO|nr:hypothetical protein [Xenorhabdus hominickii]AOM39798.1 hypothetical protein A9255_03920 [Xenorhabdus hominickii]PHM53575.1 aminoglycoside adenylyltransferase [Xenorhabdus hominickii]
MWDNCLKDIIKWAENAVNVQALIQTGSLTRKDNSSDDLSGRLEREVAQYLGFDYSQECEIRITELNRKILSQHALSFLLQ